MTSARRIRRFAPLAALAAAVLLAAGCGERSEPTGAAVSPYPVTVEDAAGPASVALASRPARVAALDKEALAILRGLGATATLAADPNGNPRVAQLVAMKPDLIVAGPSNDALQLRRLHDQIDAPFYVTGGDSLVSVERAISELGLLTDTAVRARELVAAIHTAEANVSAPAQRPSVYVDLGYLGTAPSDSYVGDLLRAAGAQDVVGPNADTGPLTPQQIAKLDPQIWLASSDAGVTLAQLRKDPVLRKVAAVRSGRFATVPSRLLDPGPQAAEALTAIAAAIHAGAR
jgi:ABC-type Fe3+-hydroxamate transport system substrate-binding protein